MKKLYSASEIAAMRLPGLPTSRDNIRIRAEREGWYSEESLGQGGIRRVYAIPEKYLRTDLSAQARAKVDERLDAVRDQQKTEGITDADLLSSIIEGVERFAQRNGLDLSPDRKAAFITLFYRYFREEGAVDQEKLGELMRRVG
ncbi:DNA-binding protein [Burkholderia multivorans]|uniref:DNA-binding protein n=1 Tax=Burkholderia multivorans TaxID=87883 RepID=UPI000D0085ED|nr:DNA-binding protein [Burkholderia multivorans]MBU9123441.1 hypothetical protein [Burkholderia multivorans]PRF42513.1 hypothetical protein C6Q04_29970 [Burkholderia multivorans]PRG50800.1 hypothetical protein C6T63_17875 [Burkholderia multivorans]